MTQAYLPLQHALSHDAFDGLEALAEALHSAIEAMPSPSIDEEQVSAWESLQASMHQAARSLSESSSDPGKCREAFFPLSLALSETLVRWVLLLHPISTFFTAPWPSRGKVRIDPGT